MLALNTSLADKDAQGCCKNIDTIRQTRESLAKQVDALHGVTQAHAPFFAVRLNFRGFMMILIQASSSYYREIGDYGEYYRETLRYLGCVDLSTVSAGDQLVLAKCMAIAAMLGKGIYNFGELVSRVPWSHCYNTCSWRTRS